MADPNMQYHVITTERCNLKCRYCGGTRHLPGIPLDIGYEMEDLIDFISKDPYPIIGFYGGEPLLAMDGLEEIMDRVPARKFTLQTNGTHLDRLRDDYLHRFDAILVSIDGGKEVTDSSRGEGTFDRVIRNVKDIRRRGYGGDLIARMAFSKEGDIYRDVKFLLDLDDPRFDHVHWQLDLFWSELDSWDDLEGWLRRYEDGMERLVMDFASSLEKGVVEGIVPFIPVMDTILKSKPVDHIRCGAGMVSFAIMTSGAVEACPIAPELPYSNVGDIRGSTPGEIRNSVPLDPPCSECDIRWVCGGRCLFVNKTMGWGRDWFDRICLTTRKMIEDLASIAPLAEELMDEGILRRDDFDYPPINNGCEIIP